MAPLNDEYAQADNNNPTNRSRDNPFRFYEPVDNGGPAPSPGDEEGQAFVAFLITMQDGYPVDFEKEYFGNQKDADSYIQTIKNSSSSDPHPQHSQRIEGYAVPKSKEHAAEQELIQQINGVEEDEEESLPKSEPGMRDTQGAYFAGQGSGGGMTESTLNNLPEIFEELEDVCKGRLYPTSKIANYLMKVFEITQAEANILARAYNSLRG